MDKDWNESLKENIPPFINAKNELEEGAFYVWKKEELKTILKDEFELFGKYYNVNNLGLWEHGNYILLRDKSYEDFIKRNKSQ